MHAGIDYDDPNILKDLKKLNMWEPLHSLLTLDTSPLSVKIQALWVIGTALQNNPAAQDAVRHPNIILTAFSDLHYP